MDGNLLAQIAIAIIALAALLVAVLSAFSTRTHNRKSVVPIAFVKQEDYEDRVAVEVVNTGAGPMILTCAAVRSPNGYGHLIDLIPDPPEGMYFRHFNRLEQPRGILPGESVALLAIEFDDSPDARDYRRKLRAFLAETEVNLNFKNVYDEIMPPHVWKMSWYGRHNSAT